jgi:hypothetical protein
MKESIRGRIYRREGGKTMFNVKDLFGRRGVLVPLILAVFATVSYGAYLINVPQSLRQPDGRILECLASGDEFYNWLHDRAGYTILQDPASGFYVYAAKGPDGRLVPTSWIPGAVDPASVGLIKGVRDDPLSSASGGRPRS